MTIAVFCQIPLGTAVKEKGQIIADLTTEGQTFLAAQGGLGGVGNSFFKTALDQTPGMSTEGIPGEEKVVELELKTIADVGLVCGIKICNITLDLF